MKSMVAGSVMKTVALSEPTPKALDEALSVFRSEAERVLDFYGGRETRIRLVLTVDVPPYELS